MDSVVGDIVEAQTIVEGYGLLAVPKPPLLPDSAVVVQFTKEGIVKKLVKKAREDYEDEEVVPLTGNNVIPFPIVVEGTIR